MIKALHLFLRPLGGRFVWVLPWVSLPLNAQEQLSIVESDSVAHTDSTIVEAPAEMVRVVVPAEKPKRKKRLSHSELTYQRYSAQLDSLVQKYRHWHYTGNDLLNNPYYAALMGSSTLYGATLKRRMGTIQPDEGLPGIHSEIPSSRHIYDITYATDLCLAGVYAECPWFVYYEEAHQGTVDVEDQIRESVKSEVPLTNRLTPETASEKIELIPEEDDFQVIVRKPNFWSFRTNFSLHFTQNYVSDNWYKGGNNNYSLLAATEIHADYNNQRKVTFDNTLEMKLGFQRTDDDDEHKFRTNSDLIRLTNRLGLRALKHWYYTILLQSWTQFYRGYKSNDPKIYSDFMSPFDSQLSVGMGYRFTSKNSRFTVNATLSPLSLKFRYVDRPSLTQSFGLKGTHHTNWEYGLSVTADYNWKLMKNVDWSGRVYYFSDYKKVQIEWENTINLKINEYLSAKLFFYPRFDDSQKRKPGKSYFQFNELLSMGLNVNF